jgi:hypothetical protein
MTVEERFERLEHYSAGLGEMFAREREEARELWRESQKRIERIESNLATISEQFVRFQREDEARKQELDARFGETEARFRETDARFRETDDRIKALVSGIGEYIRQSSK